MPKFKPYNHKQTTLLSINFEDSLQVGTFEHTLHHLLSGRLDLRSFYDQYKNDDTGRTAYDPALLLRIILFAYSKGKTSSREIEWNC